jgi:hypothetical protein
LFNNSVLSETGTAVVTFSNTDNKDGSAGDVIVSGTVYVSSISAGISADGTAGTGQILTNSTNSGTINGNGGAVILSAGSGIGSSATAVYLNKVATLDAMTNTGDIYLTNTSAVNVTTSAAPITTPGQQTVTPTTMMPYITVGAELLIDAGYSNQETVTVTAVTATTFTVTFANTHTANFTIAPSSPLTLRASTSAGDIAVNWNGNIELSSEESSTAGVVLDSISATGTVTLDANGGAIADEFDSIVSANTLVLKADNGIGIASSPLETSSRGKLTLTANAGDGLFLDSSTALTVDSAIAGIGDLSISAAGNLTLEGDVSGGNVTLTATAGTLTATTGNSTTSGAPITTTGQQTVTPTIMEPYITKGAALLIDAGADQETVTVTAVTATTFTATFVNTHAANFTISAPISADSLTITAEQIGSPSDVVQTGATTINATANYGGIYLSNANSNTLTLTAAAVGTDNNGVAPNNVTIYSASNIVLLQQTTALTQLATALPVAVFTPGGALTLFAGYTLSADGNTPTAVTARRQSSAPRPLRRRPAR